MTSLDVVLRTPHGGPWRGFQDPLKVVCATRLEDVAECLAEVDGIVRRDGCYAAGFVTYEAAGAFGLPVHAPGNDGLPLVCFGLYQPDHVVSEMRLSHHGHYEVGTWQPSLNRVAYVEAVRRIKARIEAGDTYQINFTFRLTSRFAGDPMALLSALDASQAGPWGAYVDTGRHVVCSASPELFVAIDGESLICRPMKGTAPRGFWAAADRIQAERLRTSAKNRAENVMVVDMARNDLGRIAQTGSVAVSSLFDVERYPLQWQMTSTVAARVSTATLPRLFAALFPAGSVTGAPKHSSMGIIRELEGRPRGIYTGAIGYLSPHGRGHFNVAIRSVSIDRETHAAEFGVGSGVVWDSVDEAEYDECLLKASILLPPDGAERVRSRSAAYVAGPRPAIRLIETIGWTPEEGFALLDRHLRRLHESADCFGFECDPAAVQAMLDEAVIDLRGPAKVRVLLGRDGTIVCEASDLAAAPDRSLTLALAQDPVDPLDVFLYHKTTRRDLYERARASRPEADAVILWNPSGEVTEATEANVVVEIGRAKVTPPVACGLLPGTLRAHLLDAGEILEQPVTVAALRSASRVWLINSVRGWMKGSLREA